MGADAYPQDPTRWEFVPSAEDAVESNIGTYVGIGAILLIIAGIAGFMFTRKDDELIVNKEVVGLGLTGMPDMSAQPLNHSAHPPVAMPNMNAQPVTSMPNQHAQSISSSQTTPAYQQPVAQPQVYVNPDALNYYNGLIAQGYPQESALTYTQQYYPDFRL